MATPFSTPRSLGNSTSNASIPKISFGVLLVVGILLVALNASPERILSALDWMALHRREGSAIFIVAYVMGVVLMLPAMIMAMSAGALFGVAMGSTISFVSSNIGQILAFWAGRYIFRDAVVAYLSKKFPKWAVMDAALTKEGAKLICLLRLSPIAPWNILNYALSVTSVSFVTYATASSVSILPYLVLFVYMGSMARNLADIVTGDAKLDGRWTAAMMLFSGVALAVLVWYINHVSKKAMGELVSEEEVSDLLGEVDDENVGNNGDACVSVITEPHGDMRERGTGRRGNNDADFEMARR